MSRQGFPVADIDVGLLDDPKVRALVRRLRGDEAASSTAMLVYVATILGSWAEGARLTAEEAAPMWLGSTPPTDVLVSVGLLDESHRIPEHAWASWFDPAAERREVRLERWRRANRKRRRAATALSPRGNREATEATDRPTGRSADDAALGGASSAAPPRCERCGRPRRNGEDMDPVRVDGRTLWAHHGDCPSVSVEVAS